MLAVKEMQENPELGAFRVHAALRQIGIHLSPPGPWAVRPDPRAEPQALWAQWTDP